MKYRMDCIVVGYNEMPFERYEDLLSNYGKNSEAYRDLKLSFVDINGRPTSYVNLLNYVIQQAHGSQPSGEGRFSFRCGEIPNLAAAYLSNFLRREGLNASYINLFQDEKEGFMQWLKEEPLCVAITTTFYVLSFPVNEIVQLVRSMNPKVKIVVGGPLVGNYVRNMHTDALAMALKDMGADYYIVDSQGEMTLANLVRSLKNGLSQSDIPNLMFFEDDKLVHTPVAPESNSMDEVDIKWDELAHEESLGHTIQMRTARSCAFKCAFCNYPTRAGKLSLASLDTIEREMQSIHKIGDISTVVFIDDTFNVPLPRFKDICRMMIKRQFNFNWFSYFRCSNSDEEAFDLMAKSGCKGVFLGIESGSPSILKNMNKAATIERYAEGIKALKQRGIATFGSFIVGFPGETRETVEETISFIRENQPDFYRTQMWYCEQGTPIWQERDKYKIQGEGFVWEHATMSSLEAMDYIERIVLTVKESLWLPQWSFDFWFIPYITGKGVSLWEFKQFVSHADALLASEIATCSTAERERIRKKRLDKMIELVKSWRPAPGARSALAAASASAD